MPKWEINNKTKGQPLSCRAHRIPIDMHAASAHSRFHDNSLRTCGAAVASAAVYKTIKTIYTRPRMNNTPIYTCASRVRPRLSLSARARTCNGWKRSKASVAPVLQSRGCLVIPAGLRQGLPRAKSAVQRERLREKRGRVNDVESGEREIKRKKIEKER